MIGFLLDTYFFSTSKSSESSTKKSFVEEVLFEIPYKVLLGCTSFLKKFLAVTVIIIHKAPSCGINFMCTASSLAVVTLHSVLASDRKQTIYIK